MEHIIKSSRYPPDVVHVTGHVHDPLQGTGYVCIEAEEDNGEARVHLHLTAKESRKLRKALKAAERGD